VKIPTVSNPLSLLISLTAVSKRFSLNVIRPTGILLVIQRAWSWCGSVSVFVSVSVSLCVLLVRC